MPETPNEVVFSSRISIAEVIEGLLQGAKASIDAALYRINNPSLARALAEAQRQGVRVRLLLDRGKYEETQVTRDLLTEVQIPFRLTYGRKGRGSKLHHKFVILDNQVVLAGSYNWTIESEIENYDHMGIYRDSALVKNYQQEFDQLWSFAPEAPAS